MARPKATGTFRAVGALVLVALLGWFGIRFIEDRIGPGGECAGGTVALKIAAAPEIAPVLIQVADGLSRTDRHIGPQCYAVRVSATDPARVAAALQSKADSQPDVWLPDSSFWLARVRSDGVSTMPERGISVATSPVVLAVTEPAARSLGWPNAQLNWSRLLTGTPTGQGSIRLGIPDPARSPVGVSAVLAITSLTSKDGKPTPATVSVLRQLSGNMSALSSDLFGKLPQSVDPVSLGKGLGGFPASEQSVASYDAQRPAVPVVPVYERANSGLDYPYVPSTAMSGAARAAANRFLSLLQSAEATQALNAAGFRTPSGGTGGRAFPAANGVDAGILGPAPLSDSGRVAQALGVWNTVTLPTRLLTVVDVSGSMNEQVPGTRQTRMQITISAWMQAIGLFSDDSQMGLWAFSTDLGPGGRDYKQLVPIGSLSTQRAALVAATARLQVKTNGSTGLYNSVLAAYKNVSERWDPARSNAVAVFTDGEDDNVKGISRAALLAELKKLYNPKRPVRIVFLGMGPDVNPDELAQIAKATHGLSFVARDPSKMRDIYLQALAARPCQAPYC